MFLTNFYFKGKCKKLIEPDREEDKTTEDDEAEEEEEEHKEAAAAGTAASKQPAKIEEILPDFCSTLFICL